MSFLIEVHVNEGIVLAGDRRTTYSSVYRTADTVVNNIGVHVTDSANKVFLCPNGVGISCCGDADLKQLRQYPNPFWVRVFTPLHLKLS